MPLSLLGRRGRIVLSLCFTKILWLLIVSWSLWKGLTVMASSFDSLLSVTASSGAVASEPMISPGFLIRSLFGMLVSLAVVRPPPRHTTAKKTALASNQMRNVSQMHWLCSLIWERAHRKHLENIENENDQMILLSIR